MLYLRPRVLLMVPLGFAAGLPLLLTGTTLLAVLSLAGLDLRAVGAYALVGLPYALKFLWAPLVDRWRLPLIGRLGQRRGWLLFGRQDHQHKASQTASSRSHPPRSGA